MCIVVVVMEDFDKNFRASIQTVNQELGRLNQEVWQIKMVSLRKETEQQNSQII